MATYTITINERTKEGKGLLYYLEYLGVIKKNDSNPTGRNATLAAIEEMKQGKGIKCGSFEDYKRKMK